MYRVLRFFWLTISFLSIPLLSVPATGQHYTHTALWLRLNPSVELSKRWTLTGDLYYRRQNDFHESQLNFLSRPSLNLSGRVGLSYRTQHWAITAFPLVWFNSYPTLGKGSDFDQLPVCELRSSLYAKCQALVEFDDEHSLLLTAIMRF